MLNQYTFEPAEGLPPFRGGAIGAIPYDFGWRLDGLELRGPHPEGREPLHFSFYDLVVAFDQVERRAFIFSSGFPEADVLKRQARAVQRLDEMLAALETAPAAEEGVPAISGWTSNFTQSAYHAAVEQVRTISSMAIFIRRIFRSASPRPCRRVSRLSHFMPRYAP